MWASQKFHVKLYPEDQYYYGVSDMSFVEKVHANEALRQSIYHRTQWKGQEWVEKMIMSI